VKGEGYSGLESSPGSVPPSGERGPTLAENAWQRQIDLTNRILQLTSGLRLPRGDYWPTVVAVSLTQANARLHSIRVLLNNGDDESAVILTRSLFELAANLAYICQDISKRLPTYLKHGGVPTTSEEAKELQERLRIGGPPEAKDVVPVRAWKPLKDMCSDLGSDWLEPYEIFYRYASVPTHAGAFTLGRRFIRLLTRQSPTNQERAGVMLTASEFHFRVAHIAAKTFPKHIATEEVAKLHKECSELFQSLVRH